jgi:hypothetical protein
LYKILFCKSNFKNKICPETFIIKPEIVIRDYNFDLNHFLFILSNKFLNCRIITHLQKILKYSILI